jgi:hypothetical protein
MVGMGRGTMDMIWVDQFESMESESEQERECMEYNCIV